MKSSLFLISSLLLANKAFAQTPPADTNKVFNLQTVVVTANKVPFLFTNNPGPASIVGPDALSILPKSIGVEEALRLVPGVRIDNQHDGERVHLSIRGQGILTERGLRGIGVLIDGIPVNDPSGFAPDLYDVDWNNVGKIEILKGPNAGVYGGSASGGVINIFTKNPVSKDFGGEIGQMLGSNGFRKSSIRLEGTKDIVDYSVNYSRTDGDGYRDHQAFFGNKIYEKMNFKPSDKFSLTQIVSYTDYFQQNPEGLNIGQFDNLKQANPDANPFNEYQKTKRTTIGLHGNYKFNNTQDLEFTTYLRSWDYKETSNKAAEYRTITNPGFSVQYNLHLNSGNVRNDFSIGSDNKFQNISMYKLQSASDPNRKESTADKNIETNNLLANQLIDQQNYGVFALYKMSYDKLTFLASVRYDQMNNDLTNKMLGGDTADVSKDFSRTSVRAGASYEFMKEVTMFANFSQGFIPPSTEELASNPTGYSGFNTYLVPATSNCVDIGARGFVGDKLYYEVSGFLMNTENDFFRFKQQSRGNQEVFYGNAGSSKRFGVESFFSYKACEDLSVQLAYTYANYKYTSATIDPIYTDPQYVLTNPPKDGQFLPNSPEHQLYAEVVYTVINNLKVSLGTELQSKWAIYTDSKAYDGQLDPKIYQNWQDGFNLFHARISYEVKFLGVNGECSLSVRNLTDKKYMAFTEPDPDGNSYHPAPGREIFGGLKIRF